MQGTGIGQPLLAEAWQALTDGSEQPADIKITGQQVVLPSVFPVMDIAAAAVGSELLAASHLESTRTNGRPRSVALDAGHLACAIRSEQYVRLNGQRLAGGFALLSGFFRTSDGWIRLHANYPWHRERLLQVLDTPGEPDSVAAAVSRRSAEELEDAIVRAGGCAAAVHGPAEWRAHPQGSMVSGLPLLEIERGTTTVAGLPPPGPLPASGIRVLDLTRVIAGPICTRTLAAHGADVLRIDSPDLPDTRSLTLDTLVGKRSALLDLHRAADLRQLEALVADAHVVVQGYRPGAFAGFGLSAEELLSRHPGLIVLSLSAWSRAGPWANRRGFDSLVQAATGIAMAESVGNGIPGVLPAQLLDHATGYLAAATVLLALARRQREGRGFFARVSLAQTAAWVLRQPPAESRLPTTGAEVDATPFLVDLDGPDGTVQLVSPPGRLGDRNLGWPGPPARYGADAAAWL